MSDDKPSRKGRDAILSFAVTGPDSAEVRLAVEHRDSGGTMWSCAGSVTAFAPAVATLAVPGLREERRVRIVHDADPRGPVKVRILPPEWLPC